MVRRILVHGHRGARAARPENTLAAFEYAIRAGADFIELDVLVTSDNVPVVCHDPVRNPAICVSPGGSDVVRESTAAQLAEWDFGTLRHPRFPHQETVAGARISTLGEVLDLGANCTVGFNIELKCFPGRPELAPDPQSFAALVLPEIERRGLGRRCIVQSFDWRVLRAARSLAPDLTLAALFERDDRDFVSIAEEAGTPMVSPQHTLVTPEKVRAAHAAGVDVITWTANTASNWDRMVRAGVDGIITDDPAGLIAFLRRKQLRD